MATEANASESNTEDSHADSLNRYKPLSRWLPIGCLAMMVFSRFVPGLVEDGPAMIWMVAAFGPLLFGLLILLWWLLLSRATWQERLVGSLGVVICLAIVISLLDPTMRGATVPVITVPLGLGGFALGAVLCSRILSFRRTLVALAVCFLAAGTTTLLRTDGVWGNFAFGLDWRWKPTAEEQFLAANKTRADNVRIAGDAEVLEEFPVAQWPGFRGPNRDGAQRGATFSDDWQTQPPEELWRIQVGPAWSSFAVAEPYLITQEQRGENEAVVCYDSRSGEQVWEHSTPSRFFEALGGLGPRATPTIAGNKVYALGAEGWLMRIDARNGELDWKVDIRELADCDPPMWGFSTSPLVINDRVAVHTGNKGDRGIIALNADDGGLAWSSKSSPMSYSSLQTLEILDTSLIAILTDEGAQLLDPETGANVLTHVWQHQGYRALQPQLIDGTDLLIPTGMGTGTRRIHISRKGDEWSSEEVWTSRNMKPDFNDFVVHQGHLYGFDDSIFACVDLSDGSRKWKRGRYGKGQVLLLADSDLLLVTSEKGELVLLATDPEEHRELATLQALDGKTWNHPVVVGDRLYIRNANEAVCYKLF
jgi:outer membrane protein assembly factor BamB